MILHFCADEQLLLEKSGPIKLLVAVGHWLASREFVSDTNSG